MVFAGWQATIVDEAGNVVPEAAITVLRELPGLPPAGCFADRDGLTPIGSTFDADAQGFVRFYAAGGFYRITAASGAFSREWRDVAIGTAAGTDAGLIPIAVPPSWTFDSATADADPGNGEFRLNNASPGSATAVYVDNLAFGGVDVSAWLDTLDDSGNSTLRGVLTIFDPNNPTTIFRTYAVSGSVVDGTGYRKLTVAHIAGAGSLVAGAAYQFTFSARGPAGTGDVTGPNGGVVDGHAVVWDATTGKLIKTAGAAPMLQGRHSIWVPAAAMIGGTSPPLNTVALGSNAIRTLDFDDTALEAVIFSIAMAKSWDEGDLFFQPYWTAASGSGSVAWFFAAHAASDDDTLSFNFSVFSGSGDAFIAANDLHIGGLGSGITPSGTPAAGDLVTIQVGRDPTNAGDTFTEDAKLIGVMVFYNVNAGNDA